MKEYIFNIDNQQAGTIVIPGAPTGLTQQNILAILNESTKKVLHSPFAQNVYSMTYGGTNLIITMSEGAPSAVGSLMVKLYTDVDLATEATAEAAKTAAQAAQAAAEAITIPTDYAKQGYDPDASLSDTQNYAASAAEDATHIRSALGTSSSTESSPTTLWGKVKQLYTYVTGTLKAAVDNIKSDTENIISTQSGHTTTLGNINTNMAKDDTVAKEDTLNTNTAAIEQKIEGTFVKVDFTEDGLPLTRDGGMCPITDGTDVFDGDYDMYSTHETSYAVGTIIQCTADNERDGSSNVYAFIKAGASNLGISGSGAVTGTFEFGTWKKDHYYRVAQIIEGIDPNYDTVHIFTYEELPATIVEGFDQTKEAVQAAKQAIKGNDPVATLSAIYAVLSGGAVLPDGWQQQAGMILRYLGCPAAWTDPVITAATPQEIVDELETIFTTMGIEIAPCEVGSDGSISAPSES